jgi:hypothetical protein
MRGYKIEDARMGTVLLTVDKRKLLYIHAKQSVTEAFPFTSIDFLLIYLLITNKGRGD